jgi:hypothetical protein
MTSLNKDITKLLETIFEKNTRFLNKSEFNNLDNLLSNELVKENKENSELVDLNPNSDFFDILIQYIELETKKEIPKNISDSFKSFDEFNKTKREEIGTNVINAFDDIFQGMKIHALQQFEKINSETPKEFLFSLGSWESRENHLYNFERIFFKFLPYSNYSIEEIAEICVQAWNKEEMESSLIDFLRGFGKLNIEKSKELYHILIRKECHLRIIAHVLIGNYNAGDSSALDVALDLREKDLLESLIVLGRINYLSENEISKAFDSIEPINFSDKHIASEQSYLLLQVINNKLTPKDIIEKCFKLLVDFIEKGTREIVDSVFRSITLYLDKYESGKYALLHRYLARTQDFNVVKRFFSSFKDPAYIFDLIQHSFSANPNFRFPVEIFHDGLSHSWRENQERTESLILELFNQHPAFSILAVKIILSARSGVYKVDLLKLDNKESQINAIKSLCKSPVYFDKLVPIMLVLRESNYKEVVKLLQEELAKKVFQSYHETIYELILKEIGNSSKDKEFIRPIKDALDNYNELKQLKESIKDIDPVENESDLMQLYYRLEREEQAKMMNKINEGEGSFLQFIKNTTIVRGNSWKIGEREVSPLGNIESKMLIDSSSYLNPELYESNLDKL